MSTGWIVLLFWLILLGPELLGWFLDRRRKAKNAADKEKTS